METSTASAMLIHVSHLWSVPLSAFRFLASWLRFRFALRHVATTYAVEKKVTREPQPYELKVTLKGRDRLHVAFEGLPEGDWAEMNVVMNLGTKSGYGSYTHRKGGLILGGETTIRQTRDGSISEDRRYVHHLETREVPQSFVWTPKRSEDEIAGPRVALRRLARR